MIEKLLCLMVVICMIPVAKAKDLHPNSVGLSSVTGAVAAINNLKPVNIKRKTETKASAWAKHHFISKWNGGKLIGYELVRNKDSKVRLALYTQPQNTQLYPSTRKKHTVSGFLSLLKKKEKSDYLLRKKGEKLKTVMASGHPRSLAASATPNYTSTLPTGYNQSTGIIPGSSCFNVYSTTSQAASNTSLQTASNLNSFGSATGTNESISAQASLAADGFSASGSGSYLYSANSTYDNTGYSGQSYASAYQLFVVTNAYDQTNLLTPYGQNQQTDGVFSSACGANFIGTMAAGFAVVSESSYSASSTTSGANASSSISANAQAGYNSATSQFSAAVQSAYSNNGTSSSTYSATGTSFEFTLVSYGGTETINTTTSPSATVANAFANNLQNLDNCTATYGTSLTAVTSACQAFATAVDSAISTAVTQFGTDFTSATIDGSNSAAIYPFPSGSLASAEPNSFSAFQTTSSILALNPVPAQYSDLYLTIQTQLDNYVNLYNQIATLYNRAVYLGSAMSGTYNLMPNIDINGDVLTELTNTYYNDLKTISGNLTACLSSGNPSGSACGVITLAASNGINSASAWYGINGSNPNSSAFQNTLALQYTGTVSWTNTPPGYNLSYNSDVIWYNALPNFGININNPGVTGYPTNISGQPGLVAFVDQPWSWWAFINGGYQPGPYSGAGFAQIIPTTSTFSSANNAYTVPTALTDYQAYGYDAATTGWNYDTGFPQAISFDNGCIPSSTPGLNGLTACPITASISSGEFYANSTSYPFTRTIDLYQIPGFFNF